jgi:hypothetical protein
MIREPPFDDIDSYAHTFTMDPVQEKEYRLGLLIRLLEKPLRDLIFLLKKCIQVSTDNTLMEPKTYFHVPWVHHRESYNFPYYCTTEAEACSCVDSVAKSFGFHFKERLPKEVWRGGSPDLLYVDSTETIKLIVNIFKDNWYKDQSCYSFRSYIEFRKGDGTVMHIYPPRYWRKILSAFERDVELMVSCAATGAVSNEFRTREVIRNGLKIVPAGPSK